MPPLLCELVLKAEADIAAKAWSDRARGRDNTPNSTTPGITIFLTNYGLTNLLSAAGCRNIEIPNGQIGEETDFGMKVVVLPEGGYKSGGGALVITDKADPDWLGKHTTGDESFVVGYEDGLVRIEGHKGEIWQNNLRNWGGFKIKS